MDFPGLPARLAHVRETVAQSQARGGWQHPVRIVAVTKTHGAEAVLAAVDAGLTDVGENRVQEALQKQDQASEVPVDWHLIGTLQRNKARHAAGRFALIHSVDRADLGAELERRVAPGQRQRVLVQVNCSGEPQKGGVAPESLPLLLDELRALERIEVRGLMTMSALSADDGRAAPSLSPAAGIAGCGGALRARACRSSRWACPDDYQVAVEEGATMIRLGTVLFGERMT